MIEDDDEDISALISAQDSTLDDSLTSLPFDIDISSQHSSPRSTRYGSYDVNPSVSSPVVFEPDDREVPSPIRHVSAPVFTPPPPPDSPPPSARSSTLYRDAETPSTMVYNHPLDVANQSEEEGWREWLTLDSDNVDIIDPPDMKDICVGTTPRDSVSVISSRTVSSVNTAIFTASNIHSESHDDSINNNNNVMEEFEHILNGGEGNHPVQSPSRSITSARSSPIRFVETVSPTRDSGFSLSNNDSETSDNRNSDYTNELTSETTNSKSTVNRLPLERSSSRNSMTSINSYRSAVNEMRLARAAELRNSRRSRNKNLEMIATVKAPQESPSEISVNSSSDSHISSTRAVTAVHSYSNSTHSPKNSVSSINSNTSSSTLSVSKHSDSTVSPSRLYTIGFPVGGIGSSNSAHAVSSDSDDDSDRETDVENSLQPVDDDVGEVFEGDDIIMVVLSKESKSLGK